MAKKVAAAGPVEGPWALPDGWRWCRLGDLGEFLNGAAFKPTDWGDVGTPIIRIQNLNNPDRVMNRTTRTVNERLLVRAGDLLVSWSATLDAFVWRREDAWLNQHIFKVVPDETLVDRRYMFFLLKNEIENLKKTEHLHGSTMMHINRGPFLAHLVPVPQVETQVRVAARIDELFAEIDDGEAALARARDDLARWRKALLKAAVTGELTAGWRTANPAAETGADLLEGILAERRARWEAEPRNAGKRYKEPPAADATDLPLLPAGWSWASLAQVAFVSGGLTVDAKRKPIDPVELPYMRVANVQRGHLDLSAMKMVTIDRSAVGALALASGDILLNEGGDRDKIGRGWVYEGQLPICLHQNHVFKARPAHDAVSPFLVSMYLNELGRRFFIDQGKQTTNLASISLSKVSTAPIPIPPAAEAAEILRVYDGQALPGVGADMDGMRTAAATLRQSILAAAFRGELA